MAQMPWIDYSFRDQTVNLKRITVSDPGICGICSRTCARDSLADFYKKKIEKRSNTLTPNTSFTNAAPQRRDSEIPCRNLKGITWLIVQKKIEKRSNTREGEGVKGER